MGIYRLSRAAREDLTEIIAYIATDNIDAALRISDSIEQTFAVLSDNPAAGRERPEIASEIRSFPTASYVILYQAMASEILIVRIIHSARDLDALIGNQ